jgi:hypothetical protein
VHQPRVLGGDSIFDKAAYVRGGPDVITRLNSLLPQDWRAILLGLSIRSQVWPLRSLLRDFPAFAQMIAGIGVTHRVDGAVFADFGGQLRPLNIKWINPAWSFRGSTIVRLILEAN